ncbi:MAG TPA: TonB-dependent receptor [Thermoanaerobaculia bacterium]|nr:TonB-dependent receptor [Thermoanaerobaculia bacterium]
MLRLHLSRSRRLCAPAAAAAAALAALVATLFLAPPAAAQTDVTTSRISGTVVDAKGGDLPGVTVEALNQETGLKVPAVTDAKGFYRLFDLPSGVYTVTATLEGFATAEIKDLRLTIGSAPTVKFTLHPASVTESITVTSEAPVIESTNTTFTTTLENEQIKNLPVTGRDFRNLAILTPETVIEGQRNNVAIGGERGINTGIMVDGVDYNNAFFGGPVGIAEGRAPLSLSQESIREFNLITNGGSVEFGRSGGGFINVITKSGTNSLHGSGFYYNRPQSWIANFADGRKPRNQKREQFGASLGGAIWKDKLFFFASYDRQNQNLTIPINSSVLDPAVFAKYPALASASDYIQTQNGYVAFGRLDAQLSDSQRLLFRANIPNYTGQNGTFNSPSDASTSNGNEKMDAKSYVGSYTGQFGPSLLNDFNLNYVTEVTPRLDKGLNLPAIQVNSNGAFYGEVSFLPITSTAKRKEAADTVSWLFGEHVVKGGFDYNDTSIDQIFKGNWRGVFIFNTPADLIAGKWAQYRQFGGLNGLTADQAGKAAFGQKETALFAQDQWYVRPNLTVTAGLRWERLQNPGFAILNPNDRNPNGSFNLTGKIPNTNNQYSPRLGLSWAPDPQTDVRVSIGRYWSRTPALLWAQANTSNGIRATQYTTNAITDSHGNVVAPPNDPIAPGWGNAFVATGVSRVDFSHLSTIAAPGVFTVASNFKNPHSDRATLGLEREVVPKLVAGIDLTYAQDKNLERLTDLNRQLDGTLSSNLLPHYSRTRPDKFYGAVTEYVSDASSHYGAATASLRRRYADNWSAYAAVTYSRNRDNDSNERNFAGIQAEDVNNLDLNYAFADTDIRWKIIFRTLWQSPLWGISAASAFHYYTGLPFTPAAGPDLNGDFTFTDRPTVAGEHLARNSFRNPAFYTLDLRLYKSFAIGPGQLTPLVECFNCTNAANRTVGGANTTFGLGPIPNANFGVPNFVTQFPRSFQVAVRYDF